MIIKKIPKGHKTVIVIQLFFLVLIFILIYQYYPKAEMTINGNFVKFQSKTANVIMISDSSSFINPRYLDLREVSSVSLDLKPGKYYWRPYNGYIEGFNDEFEIITKVEMMINKSENSSDLVNVGNVKINVTKSKSGMMVGRIILDNDESKKIEDNGENYLGEQA